MVTNDLTYNIEISGFIIINYKEKKSKSEANHELPGTMDMSLESPYFFLLFGV